MINIFQVALPIVDVLESTAFTLAWLSLIMSVLVFVYNIYLVREVKQKHHH